MHWRRRRIVAPSREERESITLSSWPPHLGHRILVLLLLIVVAAFVPHKMWGSQAPGAEFLNNLKYLRHPFLEHAHFVGKPLLCGKLPQPTGWLVQIFER